MIEYRGQNFVNPNPKIDDGYSGPPTPERDAKWRALHYVGDTRLSKSEASRIHNKTAAAQPDTDEDYPIVLTVFHDLHCLVCIYLLYYFLILLAANIWQGRNSTLQRIHEGPQMEFYV